MFSSTEEFRFYVERYYRQNTWLNFVRETKRPLIGIPLDKLVREFHCHGLNHRTSFFSEEVVRIFEAYLLPLFQTKDHIRILSLPCSGGQEVYSLATLAWDNGFRDFSVEGREVCDTLISKAKKQEYWIEQERKDRLQPFIDKNYFWIRKKKRKHDHSHNLMISEGIIQRCNFETQDILLEEVPSGYDAILCFNLFMHLSQKGKEAALSNLSGNLSSGDLLFLGESYQANQGYGKNGWNLERERRNQYNRFVGELEERSQGEFRKIGEPNAYRKV